MCSTTARQFAWRNLSSETQKPRIVFPCTIQEYFLTIYTYNIYTIKCYVFIVYVFTLKIIWRYRTNTKSTECKFNIVHDSMLEIYVKSAVQFKFVSIWNIHFSLPLFLCPCAAFLQYSFWRVYFLLPFIPVCLFSSIFPVVFAYFSRYRFYFATSPWYGERFFVSVFFNRVAHHVVY